jgi:hypothetical protein
VKCYIEGQVFEEKALDFDAFQQELVQITLPGIKKP